NSVFSVVGLRKVSVMEFPLRLGREEDFARTRSLLNNAQFDEETICRIFKIRDMAKLSSLERAKLDLSSADSDLLALLIKLFILVDSIPYDEVKRHIDAETIDALFALDILRKGNFADEETVCYSTVFLYPVAGMLIASDRHNNPDGSPFVPPEDIVFPAINNGTLLFLKVISKTPTEDVLDIGSGSGIAALVLSKNAKRAVASDIPERSTHFASFNRLLNSCLNVETVKGDLYEPVEGRMFDRITAHPPYVPAIHKTVIYRDGGETGETLVKRIIEGLPLYLKPGGTFYCLCMGLDTEYGGFENRVRQWLGEAEDGFDVIFALGEERSTKRFARELVGLQRNDYSDIVEWDRIFAEIGAKKLVYGALVVHRHSEDERKVGVKPLTMRPKLISSIDGSYFDWAIKRHHRMERTDALKELAQMKPRLSPSLSVKITHIVHEGSLVPWEHLLEGERPFPYITRVDPWVVSVVAEFNGRRSVEGLYNAARDASAFPEGFGLDDFLRMTSMMIERGYLEIDDSTTPS